MSHIQADIPVILQKTTISLSDFLSTHLPRINESWWEKHVLNFLSFSQLRRLEQDNTQSLAGLDLAALLRVMDGNWYWLSSELKLSRENRHYVKEMQSVRNRHAHSKAQALAIDDLYRDLDTIQRFASIIQTDASLIEDIQNGKKSLISPDPEPTPPSKPTDDKPKTEFSPGQMVTLCSNPEIKGAVIGVLPGEPENRYQVFVKNETHLYYASQLQPENIQKKATPVLNLEEFHACLTALQIRFPGLFNLYSLNAARIDFVPYQFRPVLKFIRSDRPRLLIADSVGVGKTIEAGLILRELQARRDIRSVLIICPRPLVAENKWRNEMKRFEERFEHLDGKNLRYCIQETDRDGEWPDRFKNAILPYSLFDEVLLQGQSSEGKRRVKRKIGLLDLDPPPKFDLVIVDEAHHIRNTDTFTHKGVRFFCDHAEAVVFLTATPIQLGDNDLFVLLNTLRPDLIIDRKSYLHMAEPNPFINQAVSLARSRESGWETESLKSLDEAAETAWGRAMLKSNPEFSRIRDRLTKGNILMDERVHLISDMESLHTFSGIINRTRRRDIGDFTVRKPQTVSVSFTPSQQVLHDAVLDIQAEIFRALHGNVFVKFLMTTIRRQAASCLFGLVPFLEDILNRHVDELEWAETDTIQTAPGENAVAAISDRIQKIIEIARTIDPKDPKLDTLRGILKEKQALANNRIMVFSSFRHTLAYIHRHLKADGFRVGMVHGDIPDEERTDLRERFTADRNQPEALDVLLFTEVGCEGLDYQFCDCMINYDLPWNPMRIEQRIGRIDRRGQKSEAVAIYNMITPGTVDAEIYYSCLVRIGIFDGALGGGEKILGDISSEIKNIAEDLTLTDEERREKLEQLADNKIRQIKEEERLEEQEKELFGIQISRDQINREIADASSFWLTSSALLRLINLYLHRKAEKDQEFILGEKPLKTLRLSEAARRKLLEDYQKIPRKPSIACRQWENWLKGGEPHLSITFESECAAAHPQTAFITPVHPLTIQAARSLKKTGPTLTALKVKTDDLPAGKYLFAVYQWRFHGVRENLVLRPIAMDDRLTAKLPLLLEQAETVPARDANMPDISAWGELDVRHHALWSGALENHRQQTVEIAKFQKESLTTSHDARMALLNEQLSQAGHEKIRKMRESQMAAAEADYSRRIQDLDIARERADIAAQPVVFGVMIVEAGEIQK